MRQDRVDSPAANWWNCKEQRRAIPVGSCLNWRFMRKINGCCSFKPLCFGMICYAVRAAWKQANLFQSCPTLCNPEDCSPPASSVHGILQARILEWVAMPPSRGSSWPRGQTHITHISYIGRGFFTTSVIWVPMQWELTRIKYLPSSFPSTPDSYLSFHTMPKNLRVYEIDITR